MDTFYKQFEDRFRGSRELIFDRLKIYLPLIYPLKDIYPEAGVIDLGCGRGEWLELLLQNGFRTHGVDTDECMLAEARLHGVSVEKEEALIFLKKLPDNSVSLVTGMHVAEHMPFPLLYEVIKQAHRVLKPAGLLILETPNPENMAVASNSFYMDPTHIRPLPPPLLSFIAESLGFRRTTIFRLNGDPVDEKELTPIQAITGASPDYSLVAQKTANADHLALFDREFLHKHGYSYQELVSRYHESSRNMALQLESLGSKFQALQQEILDAELESRSRERLLVENGNLQRRDSAKLLERLVQNKPIQTSSRNC